MTESLFEKSFMALGAAKLQAPDPEFIKAKRDVYWVVLRDIPDDLWQNGVRKCLQHGNFFPSIEELAEASLGIRWAWQNTPTPEKISWEHTLQKILTEQKQIQISGETKKLRQA